MKKYVISLKTENTRRAHITSEFSQQKISFDFFDAITPDQAIQYAHDFGLTMDERYLTSGELACFMSHFLLWQKALDENLPYIAIFEDDIFLGESAVQFLMSDDWIPTTLDVVKLEAFAPKVVLGAKIASVYQRDICYLKGANLGAAGYILSKDGAKSLIAFIKNAKILLPLDHMVFELYLKEKQRVVGQVVPALCIQELELNKIKNSGYTLKSALLDERHCRMKSHKVKGFAKLKKEAARLPLQLYNLLFARKVEFK
ncbi:glycosyltransferase family 25 protein [Acinetobacter sp. B5B]|uniref:glycosyltransferase family 25 protein n=1 Tax=Acinetobacter baretiae TaxID=2605383 RepID=UPI0018C31201|nr:glycosyltransferase family 25 protein [Acinetobacter baretiae]MBF7682337.1 glycosyltransferase family 25 protein [Acinetobacter baretiae]MBF7685165.1 glycosyltransferase family 25 protein [Acinetobacter baretiae]